MNECAVLGIESRASFTIGKYLTNVVPDDNKQFYSFLDLENTCYIVDVQIVTVEPEACLSVWF